MNAIDEKLEQARLRRTLPSPEVARLLRRNAGLSRDEVAELLGVSRWSVWRWEEGIASPTPRVAPAYARLLERLAREVDA
jgi:transcriptional regulator with XRE-family HTH domain